MDFVTSNEVALPVVSGVHVGAQEVSVQPRGLTVQERDRVRADEVLFDVVACDSQRYAEIIAYEAWRLARANVHLTEPDRLALVWVCTECRSAVDRRSLLHSYARRLIRCRRRGVRTYQPTTLSQVAD